MFRISACRAARALAIISLLISSCACVSGLQRGVTDPGGAYVSNARPALQVSVADMPLVTHGAGSGTLMDPGVVGGLSVDTWLAVYARGPEGPMAVVLHAELDNVWYWSTVWPHAGSLDPGTDVISGQAFAGCTFGEPARGDAFAGLAGEDVSDKALEERPVYWLTRYMAAVLGHNDEKLVLLYREPMPETLSPEELAAFRKRATAAFTITAPDGSAVRRAYPEGVRWRLVNDHVLGPVMTRAIAY